MPSRKPRNRVAALALAGSGVIVGTSIVVAHVFHAPILFALSVPAVVLLRNMPQRLLARRAFARYRLALAADDDAGAHRILTEELAAIYPDTPATRAWVRLNEGSILSLAARFVEARRVLEALDAAALAPVWQPFLLNNLAWVLVHLGEGARALELARRSIEAKLASYPMAEDFRASQHGVLGAALVVTGAPDAALPHLELSLARRPKARSLAARAFFLGEACVALGRSDEANAAYRRARDAAPTSHHGQRAAAKLQHAYR